MARRRKSYRRRSYVRAAPRRRRRAVYYARPKRRYSRGNKMFGGKMKPIIDGVVAGAIGQVAGNYIGSYGHPVSALGVGFVRNNPVLITEGARGLGAALAANFVGGTGRVSQV